MEITEMQRKMYEACGHEVEIHFSDGDKPIIGKCINYTKPLDNDPEVASMDIKVQGLSYIYEIFEEEIKTLIIKD